MAKAVITLDDKDGQISMSLFLEGGYQASSNAHQQAGLILKYLDSLAGMKTEQAVQWVDGAYVPKAEAEAQELGRPGVYGDTGSLPASGYTRTGITIQSQHPTLARPVGRFVGIYSNFLPTASCGFAKVRSRFLGTFAP